MKTIGFEYQETLTGTYTLSGRTDPPRRFSITARLHAPSALGQINTQPTLRLDGSLDMEGFAEDVPVAGRLEIRVAERALDYEFTFCDDLAVPCVFQGQREVRLGDLKDSLTTLLGVVSRPGGEELARVKAVFDVKTDLLPFLISWRPVGLGASAR